VCKSVLGNGTKRRDNDGFLKGRGVDWHDIPVGGDSREKKRLGEGLKHGVEGCKERKRVPTIPKKEAGVTMTLRREMEEKSVLRHPKPRRGLEISD